MMSDKQYKVARKGIVEQLKLAQRLHCKHMEQKYKEAFGEVRETLLKAGCRGLLRFGRKGIK